MIPNRMRTIAKLIAVVGGLLIADNMLPDQVKTIAELVIGVAALVARSPRDESDGGAKEGA